MNQQLELHSLSKEHKKSESYTSDNINLHFSKGEVTTIAGHNGAGKTTMLNQIISITKSTKGFITFSGLSFARNSKVTGGYVSAMPQLHVSLAGITMAQSAESIVGIRRGSRKIAEEEYIEVSKELKMDGWKDIPGQKLSGGLRRLTSFVMAIVYPSPIIVLDEPTSDIDPIRQQKIRRYLKELPNKEHMIIMVTYNILEVKKYADRYILMNHGKVLEDKNLKRQSIKMNDRDYTTINFLNLSDLKSVIVPSAIQTSINDEELMIEMELENNRVLGAVDWVMKLVIEKKVQNYKVSPKSLNETYGELIDGNNRKL